MADLEQFYDKLFQFLYKNKKGGHDMIGLMKDSGRSVYDLKEFVADAEVDVASLPRDCAMGSTCFVIESGEVYMLNGEKVWVKI